MDKQNTQQVSIWGSFESLLREAEQDFFKHNYTEALKKWREYSKIMGTSIWYKITDDLTDHIKKVDSMTMKNSNQYFELWLQLRNNIKHNNIGHYVYNLMEKLYAKDFLDSKSTLSFDLATGIFCFIENRIDNAKTNLEFVLNQQPDNLLARIYLSKCFFIEKDETNGVAYLSQALFLASDDILIDDIIPEKIRNLYGRLKITYGRSGIGIWLLPFEVWYRNWLILQEDINFFRIMQQKERNERILQVKYYLSEKYRHFIHCLFMAEYVRQFLAKEKGIIWEQESYMDKLDSSLFQRYRKKRKPIE
jgi:hypothetical protein